MTPSGGGGGGGVAGITVSERGAAVPERRMARLASEVPSEGDEKVKPASSHMAAELVVGSAAGTTSAAAGTGEGDEETKKEVVRRTPQAQVDRALASTPAPFSDPLPTGLGLPAHLLGVVAGALVDAARLMLQLAEIEAEEEQHGDGDGDGDGDGEEVVVVPRPGRRRYRPGVRKEAGGRVRRVN